MRRGMLMTVLQQYAQEQDVWRGKPGETYVAIYMISSNPNLLAALTVKEVQKSRGKTWAMGFILLCKVPLCVLLYIHGGVYT